MLTFNTKLLKITVNFYGHLGHNLQFSVCRYSHFFFNLSLCCLVFLLPPKWPLFFDFNCRTLRCRQAAVVSLFPVPLQLRPPGTGSAQLPLQPVPRTGSGRHSQLFSLQFSSAVQRLEKAANFTGRLPAVQCFTLHLRFSQHSAPLFKQFTK